MDSVQRFKATKDTALRAVLSDVVALVYDQPPDAKADIAPHVRAASSVRRWGNRVVIISDDTNVIAVRDKQQVQPVLLPTGHDGRRTFGAELGNKKHKLDLEASVVLPDGRVVAFGSGSTLRRERLVVMKQDQTVRMVDGHEFYALLQRTPSFSGSELNVEGALILGNVLRLFQRGNGAEIGGVLPINATADVELNQFVSWLDNDDPKVTTTNPLTLTNIVQYDLGSIQGVPWTFTDAALSIDGSVVFTAAAEASEDTYRDGEVLGSCFGVIREDEVQLVEVCDTDGQRMVIKIEGIEPDPVDACVFSVVIDMDRPDEPALLGRLVVSFGAC